MASKISRIVKIMNRDWNVSVDCHMEVAKNGDGNVATGSIWVNEFKWGYYRWNTGYKWSISYPLDKSKAPHKGDAPLNKAVTEMARALVGGMASAPVAPAPAPAAPAPAAPAAPVQDIPLPPPPPVEDDNIKEIPWCDIPEESPEAPAPKREVKVIQRTAAPDKTPATPAPAPARSNTSVSIYTYGSYSQGQGQDKYSWAFVAYEGDKMVVSNSGCGNDPKFAQSRNIAGELSAVLHAMKWAVEDGYKNVEILYNNMAAEKLATGKWKAKTEAAKAYVDTFRRLSAGIKGKFTHANDSKEADKLAKSALVG